MKKKPLPPISAPHPTAESMADRDLTTAAAKGPKSPGERMWFPLVRAGLVVGFVLAPSWTMARQLAQRLLSPVVAVNDDETQHDDGIQGTAGPMLDVSPKGKPGEPGPQPCSWWHYAGADEGGRPRFRRTGARWPNELEGPMTPERLACLGPRLR